MIRVTCDGCDKPIDRDNDAWFGVDYNPAPEPIHPDPVEAMNEAETALVSSFKVSFGSDQEHHFCSAECMAAWGFGRSIE